MILPETDRAHECAQCACLASLAGPIERRACSSSAPPLHLLRTFRTPADTQPLFWGALSQTLNQVVIWDQIISDPANARIRSNSVANKYSLTDQGYGLRGNNMTLVVNWNVVPSTGLLKLQHDYRAVHSFLMPDEYSPSA